MSWQEPITDYNETDGTMGLLWSGFDFPDSRDGINKALSAAQEQLPQYFDHKTSYAAVMVSLSSLQPDTDLHEAPYCSDNQVHGGGVSTTADVFLHVRKYKKGKRQIETSTCLKALESCGM